MFVTRVIECSTQGPSVRNSGWNPGFRWILEQNILALLE